LLLNKGIKNEIFIASTVLFLIISISTISVASAGPNDVTTSEGNVISHYDLTPNPTGPDTIEVFEPKANDPKQGEKTDTLNKPDPDTSNFNAVDLDINLRTEEFTPAEKMGLDIFTQEFKPGIVQTNAPTKSYNCHSFTFDKSKQWLVMKTTADPTGQIGLNTIIADQGYRPLFIPPEIAVAGDIIIYKDGAGNIIHSGKVTMADGFGVVTEVQSKWAQSGEYKHAPNNSPYGTNWEIFRTLMVNPEIGSPTIPKNTNLFENEEALVSLQIPLDVLNLAFDCTGQLLLDSSPQPPVVGGELLPIDTTALLVAGTQTGAAWMIPVIVSGIGFAIVLARKF